MKAVPRCYTRKVVIFYEADGFIFPFFFCIRQLYVNIIQFSCKDLDNLIKCPFRQGHRHAKQIRKCTVRNTMGKSIQCEAKLSVRFDRKWNHIGWFSFDEGLTWSNSKVNVSRDTPIRCLNASLSHFSNPFVHHCLSAVLSTFSFLPSGIFLKYPTVEESAAEIT